MIAMAAVRAQPGKSLTGRLRFRGCLTRRGIKALTHFWRNRGYEAPMRRA